MLFTQVFELLTARNLFNPRQMGNFTAEQYHFARIYGTLTNDADHERLRAFFKTGSKYETFFRKDGGTQLP